MPFHLNQVNLSGTLTRRAEVTYTPKGTAVCGFSLAINRTWKDDGGNKNEETTFVDCEAWGRTAETIGEWTDKGHTIFVEGRLKLDQWEDKQSGQKRSKIKVVVEKMHFVAKPKNESGEDGDGSAEDTPPPRRQQQQRQQQRPAQPPADLDTEGEDDIPF